MERLTPLALIFLCSAALACTDPVPPAECTIRVKPSSDDQTHVQEVLIDAIKGDVICFDDGTYTFTDEISLTVDDVKVRGTFDKAVFDFSDQVVGAQGLLITSDNVIVESLHVKNMPGDGIRVNGATGVTFRKTKVSWDAGSVEENGDYGIYPVGCTNVLVEESIVTGSSDAGIYVGQSNNIIVRYNVVHGNVAGIEIENSTNAEVYGNHTYDNTAGILVFNLSNLYIKDGRKTKVYDNIIENNNRPNFGAPGSIVGQVPAGVGSIILASDETQVLRNTYRGNSSAAVLVIARTTVDPPYVDDKYDPFTESTLIADNVMENNGDDPQDILAGIAGAVNGTIVMQDIVWDGTFDATKDNSDGSLSLCIQGNGSADFANIDADGDFANPSFDLTPHDCVHPELPAIAL